MNPHCHYCNEIHPFAEPFSVAAGTALQQKNLADLERILKPSVFTELQHWAMKESMNARCGHEVIRGQTLWDELHRLTNELWD